MMVSILALWVPILVSAVMVFIASSIVHMVIRHHRSEYGKLPHEETVTDTLRKENLQPGAYYFPHMTSPADMKLPEMIEKFKNGPVGFVNIMPSGPPAMGKNLVLWFAYSILIGVFVAYVVGRSQGPGAHYLTIFRFAGTIAFLGYGVGHIVDSIWMGRKWSATFKHVFDGFLYALLTAGTFGWLWPRS